MDIMKLFFISLVFIFFGNSIHAEDIDISKVRKLYIEAAESEKACDEMLELLSFADEKTPLLLAYKASATMMMANHVGNPFSKLSYFKKGRKMFDQAVAIDKSNVELKVLRYVVQINAPSFLGYNGDIESDKTFILNNIPKMKNIESKDFVTKVLNESTQFKLKK